MPVIKPTWPKAGIKNLQKLVKVHSARSIPSRIHCILLVTQCTRTHYEKQSRFLAALANDRQVLTCLASGIAKYGYRTTECLRSATFAWPCDRSEVVGTLAVAASILELTPSAKVRPFVFNKLFSGSAALAFRRFRIIFLFPPNIYFYYHIKK